MKLHALHLAFLVAATATGAHAVTTTESPNKFRYNYTLISSDVPPNWTVITKYEDQWEDVGDKYDCSNWSPSTSSQGKGVSFVQTATDCLQDQEKGAQNYSVNNITHEEVKNGPRYTIKQTVTVSSTRDAVGILENWLGIAPNYTSWIDTNALYGCTAWSPNPSTFTVTNTFTQTSSTCKTDQERQRQEREQEKFTDEIRDNGAPVTEQQTLDDQTATRPYSVTLGGWTAVGQTYECSNWSPAVDTIGKGIKFTQNATDCKLNQTRTRAESFKDHQSNQLVPINKPNENRTLTNQASSQESTGTLEEWMPTTPTYTAWANTSALNACSNWAPNPVIKTSTSTFTQTANNCTTDQTRNRQDREKEQNTGEIRDKGVSVAEAQTLNGQTASRSYTVILGAWNDNGAKYACSNWSPAVSAVTIGQTFEQTATDCKQDQTRTRAESYVDHKTGSTVPVATAGEVQTLTNQTSTQTATGTKETWGATTAIYSAWTNSSAVYGCTGWSPSPSAYTVRTQFTQTGSSCSINQTRTRQDREIETTTGAIRNNGAAVAENQTIGGQSTTRDYLMDYSAWDWAGGYYSCGGWSPDPSTVNSGVAFTQTAYCYRNQQRGAAGYTYNGGWVADPAVPYRVETQAYSGQPIYQTAYGTKPTIVCRYDSSNQFAQTWYTHGQWYNYSWTWNGVSYGNTNSPPAGFSKGALMQTVGSNKSNYYYQICKL